MNGTSDMGNGHDTVRRVASDVQEQVSETAQRALDRFGIDANDLDRRVRTFVHDHPTAAVLGAAAIGFFIGRLLVRR